MRAGASVRLQQILSIQFFDGGVEEGVSFILRHGSFVVAPSWICFARLHEDQFAEPAEPHCKNVRNTPSRSSILITKNYRQRLVWLSSIPCLHVDSKTFVLDRYTMSPGIR